MGVDRSDSGGEGGGAQSEFRERLWDYLLNNMVRAVDEVYFLCELECGRREIEDTVRLLEESASDFRALVRRVASQEMFARSPGLRAISWDVGRTDVRPSPRHAEMIHAVTGRKPRGGGGGVVYGQTVGSGGGGGEEEEEQGGWQTAGKGGRAAATAAGTNAGKVGKRNKRHHRAETHVGAGGGGGGDPADNHHYVGGGRSKRVGDRDGVNVVEESVGGGDRDSPEREIERNHVGAASKVGRSAKTVRASQGKPPLPSAASADRLAAHAAVPADRLVAASW